MRNFMYFFFEGDIRNALVRWIVRGGMVRIGVEEPRHLVGEPVTAVICTRREAFSYSVTSIQRREEGVEID